MLEEQHFVENFDDAVAESVVAAEYVVVAHFGVVYSGVGHFGVEMFETFVTAGLEHLEGPVVRYRIVESQSVPQVVADVLRSHFVSILLN